MKEKREKKINFAPIIIIVLIIFIFVFGEYSRNKYENKIKTYTGSTIGIANSFKHYAKTKDLNYYFYINGQRIISKTSGRELYNKDLKKFYQIKYDISNPENNHIVLSHHLQPDSLTLVKTGFKRVKYYEHDIATNTYKERYKWR